MVVCDLVMKLIHLVFVLRGFRKLAEVFFGEDVNAQLDAADNLLRELLKIGLSGG